MNFSSLPLNTSQIYVQVPITGGCMLYLPAINEAHAKALKGVGLDFAKRQRSLIEASNPGDDLA